jgi:CheY-like chemotaxis protein
LGAYTFLQHPILPDQLVEAVRDAENEGCTERILIIDDQPESTRLLMQLLDTYSSYRVFAASSGREGVSLVARRRPDLVILDLRMPEMDGFAVLQELRANPETASIPVMIVTGDTLNADEQNQLVNVGLMYKTDISLEDYQRFIHGVETHLARNGE